MTHLTYPTILKWCFVHDVHGFVADPNVLRAIDGSPSMQELLIEKCIETIAEEIVATPFQTRWRIEKWVEGVGEKAVEIMAIPVREAPQPPAPTPLPPPFDITQGLRLPTAVNLARIALGIGTKVRREFASTADKVGRWVEWMGEKLAREAMQRAAAADGIELPSVVTKSELVKVVWGGEERVAEWMRER